MTRLPLSLRIAGESALAIASAALAVGTLFAGQWIEHLLGVDPDGGSGLVEWVLVGGLLATSMLWSTRARIDWRRRQLAHL